MKVLVIDNGTKLLEKLQVLIPGNEAVVRFDSLKLDDTENVDLVILSGGSLLALNYNEDKFAEELSFISNTTKPLIGICFGFELIVKAFGGELEQLADREKGIKEVKILDKNFYEKQTVHVYENHRWGVAKLPESFQILATSERGPEIIKHELLPIYGFQFHPENFVDELEGDEIFLQLFSKLHA